MDATAPYRWRVTNNTPGVVSDWVVEVNGRYVAGRGMPAEIAERLVADLPSLELEFGDTLARLLASDPDSQGRWILPLGEPNYALEALVSSD
jgi:hypothetical protein